MEGLEDIPMEALSKLSNADILALESGNLEGLSDEGVSLLSPTTEVPEKSWEGALTEGVFNMPSSIYGVGSDLVEAVSHPIDTGTMIIKALSGALQHALPEDVVKYIDPEGKSAESKQIASVIGEHFSNKYGSEASIKEAIAKDPAYVLADIATILTGGGAAVTKLGKVSNLGKVADIGTKMSKAATIVDPITGTIKGAASLGKGIGATTRETLGMTTGVGAEPVAQAFKAGMRGGDIAKQFLDNLRGHVPMGDVLVLAKQNLDLLKKKKLTDYKTNMKAVKSDKQVLGFDTIDKALSNADKMVSYKGQVKNPVGADAVLKIRELVNQWKKLDPAEFHTPEGLDALKQRVWSVRESIDVGNRTAQSVAQGVYNQIKATISKQAPIYSKTMKEYTETSDMIREMERAFSMGDKASLDTTMRKLQSLMRDNVSTNYGQRLSFAKELEKQGAGEFLPSLAGQSLAGSSPRGMQKIAAMPEAFAAGSVGGIPAGAAVLAASSPKLVGEASHAAGALGRIMKKPFKDIPKLPVSNEGMQGLLNFLYQTQQIQEDK